MIRTALLVNAVLLCMGVTPTRADECWTVSQMKGFSAYADEEYRFIEDGIARPITICFEEDTGTVTGTDAKLTKFGPSTLVGYGGNEIGNELIEVYQLDRANNKMLYIKSRIGTKTVMPLFSDVVSAYVGDAMRVSD